MLTLRNMWCYMSVERKGVVMVFGIFSMIFSLVWFWPARKGATALQHAGMGDNLKPVPSSQLWLFPGGYGRVVFPLDSEPPRYYLTANC